MLRLNIMLTLFQTAVVARTSGEDPIRALEKPPHIPIHIFRPDQVDIDVVRSLQTRMREMNDIYSDEQGTKCNIIMDNFLGAEGVERAACRECYEDPDDPDQYVLFCDFSDLCNFCSPERDSCYTLTHEYKVRLTEGLPHFPSIVSYSACGIYHDNAEPNVAGRKACLDETYDAKTGELASKCISVDDISCDICEDWEGCEGDSYWYGCSNIEEQFFLDDCRPSFNDEIPKSSVFIGFNYGVYNDDTAACYDDSDGILGNIPVPTTSPTLTPTTAPTITARPTISHRPTLFPTVSMEPSVTDSDMPSAWPSILPSQWPTYMLTGSSSPDISSAVPSVWPSTFPSQSSSNVATGSSSSDTSLTPSFWPSSLPSQQPSHSVKTNNSSSLPLDVSSQEETISDPPSTTPSTQLSSSSSNGATDQPSNESSATLNELSQEPSGLPSASPSYLPTDAPSHMPTTGPTKQSAVQLDKFSLTLSFDAETVGVNDVTESLTDFLISEFSIEYSNLAGMDLIPTERVRTRGRRALTSSSFDFEGVARFYNQAPNGDDVRAYEANTLAKLDVLHHGDWVVEEVVFETSTEAREDDIVNSGCQSYKRYTFATAAFVATVLMLLG